MIIKIKKNVKLCITFLLLLLVLYISVSYSTGIIWSSLFSNAQLPDCNPHMRYNGRSLPTIALVGPPGSGVEWVRYLIEQMTGIYTDNVNSPVPLPENKKDRVIMKMSHQISQIHGITGAIIVYRPLKDTLRSEYAQIHGQGAFLEAPLSAYYGKEWPKFAWKHGNEWGQMYSHYLDTAVPSLVIDYDELNDPEVARAILLKASSYLHVPISSSILQCVVDRASPLLGGTGMVGPPGEKQVQVSWPRPHLKTGFQPFTLLPHDQQLKLDAIATDIHSRINLAKYLYRPKVR